ncbi:hypothetical protein niasHT_038202 [Heterodera trifolii]|uniref:Uncharacterized protein n=1 Tax=Heterodera trifolii TaxID=157864 RepID=A0ABD2IXG3_9BILA
MTKPQQFTVIFPFLQLCAFFSIICEAVKDNDKNQNNQTAPQSTNSAPPTIIYQNEPPVIHRPAPKKLIVFKPQPNKPPQQAAAGPSPTSSSSTHFQRGESKFQMLDGVEKRLLLPPKWLDEMNDNNTN